MRYRLLGRTGLRVSELCLGAMMFGAGGSAGASPQESAAIVRRFAEAGGNFIDTANRYAKGESERIVGDLIRADRDRWVLATKYTLTTDPEDPNAGGTHRKSLRRAIDASLERLGTDYIDLYYVHTWDAFTPVEEVIGALDDVVRSGTAVNAVRRTRGHARASSDRQPRRPHRDQRGVCGNHGSCFPVRGDSRGCLGSASFRPADRHVA